MKAAPAPRVVDRWWVMFTTHVGRELDIPDTLFDRLRSVDARYESEYVALGDEPALDPRYIALSERRNADVKKLLSPQQFRLWSERYDPLR